MSLSSILQNPSSPITQYINFVAMEVADAKRGPPWGEALKHQLGLDVLPKETPVLLVDGANAGIVGMAFDYRLRYHLAPSGSEDFAARRHCQRVASSTPTAKRQLEWFFSNLGELTTSVAIAGQSLDDAHEELLARYCIVLALIESVFRSQGAWMMELPPASKKRADPGTEPLLVLANDASVLDVVNLSRSAERTFAPLIELTSTAAIPYHPNPMFAGSPGIGGADADFIIGDAIFELKTTKKLDSTAVREALRQVIGYSLLDYDDRYVIRKVGLYFARQEWIVSWPLWTMVFPPAEVLRWTANGEEPSETGIAQRLTKLRRLMKTVVGGTDVDYEAEFGQ